MSKVALIAVAITLAALPATGAAVGEMLPPVLPIYFEGEFVEFTAPLAPSPPYANGIPPPPFKASRGKVYYDWQRRSMIEERLDYCVNIFEGGNSFNCTFQNVNGTSFLISGPGSPFPSCCVFGQPWYPPEPAFLRQNVSSKFSSREAWDCAPADWFIVPSIAPPTGPFWYSFRNTSTSPQVYLSFSFPGIEGWVQQNFVNIVAKEPPAAVWDLPASCQGPKVPNCGFMARRRGGLFGL